VSRFLLLIDEIKIKQKSDVGLVRAGDTGTGFDLTTDVARLRRLEN
jgi:hypothetical protein